MRGAALLTAGHSQFLFPSTVVGLKRQMVRSQCQNQGNPLLRTTACVLLVMMTTHGYCTLSILGDPVGVIRVSDFCPTITSRASRRTLEVIVGQKSETLITPTRS